MPKRLPNFKTFDLDSSIRPFAKVRLVVLDLDGTIIESSESELPLIFFDLANKLKHPRYKVRLTIATGRTLEGARPLLDRLPILKDTPIILYNGSLMLNRKYEILDLKTISNHSFQRVIDLCSRFDVKVIAYVCKWLDACGLSERAFGWSSIERPQREHNRMPVKWLPWGNVDDAITPSAIVIHTAGQLKAIRGLNAQLARISGISCTRGGTSYIEVTPENSNKRIALEMAAKRLELSRDQILAMGDNDNDAEMLAWAGIGVAVDSASRLAASSSDYKAERGVIEGAIEVLRLVQSARRLLGQ